MAVRRLAAGLLPEDFERRRHLGPKLGPVLLQLPLNLRSDLWVLDATLDAFPKGVRVVVEPRHPSWFDDAFFSLLAARGAALCLSDSPERRGSLCRTAEFGYLRFHAGTGVHACAVRDAIRFAASAGRAGLAATRVPPPGSVHLASA